MTERRAAPPHGHTRACTARLHTHTAGHTPVQPSRTHTCACTQPWRAHPRSTPPPAPHRPLHARNSLHARTAFPVRPPPSRSPPSHAQPPYARATLYAHAAHPPARTHALLSAHPYPKTTPPHLAHVGTRQLQSQDISLSLTHALTSSSRVFPLCSATPGTRAPAPLPTARSAFHPKTHLQGWISQGSHLVLPSVITVRGCCRRAREPGHCPVPGLAPQGSRRKTAPASVSSDPAQHRAGNCLVPAKKIPQNQPLVHFPSLFLGAKGQKDVSEGGSYM